MDCGKGGTTFVVRAYLEIGVVTGAHGLKGLLRAKLFTVDPGLLTSISRMRMILPDGRVEDHEQARFVSGTPGRPLLFIPDVTHRDSAEWFRGTRLLVHREDLPELRGDEFYLVDAIGCPVQDIEGSLLGQVEGIGDNGAQGLLIVSDGVRRFEVPAVPPLLSDFDGSRVVVELPDGYIEALSEEIRTLP